MNKAGKYGGQTTMPGIAQRNCNAVVSKRHHILPLNLFLWPNNKHVRYSLVFPNSFGLK